MSLLFIILVTISASFALSYGHARYLNPLFAIAKRWLKLLALGYILGTALMDWGIVEGKPLWLLTLVLLLVLLLAESVYSWFGIRFINRSDVPLFPRFIDAPKGHEWPNHPYFRELKNCLREHRFAFTQSSRANISDQNYLRSTFFLDPSETIRVQVIYMPRTRAVYHSSIVFSSKTKSGEFLVTDNIQLPFGGFYPETISLVRKPLQVSFERLFVLHKSRMEASGEAFEPWVTSPLDDVNKHQRLVELANIDAGILFPIHMRSENGRLTGEGIYRMWRDFLMMKYFGVSTSN